MTYIITITLWALGIIQMLATASKINKKYVLFECLAAVWIIACAVWASSNIWGK